MRGGEFHQAIDFAEPGTDVLGKLAALLRLQPRRLTGIELLQDGLAPGGPERGGGRPVGVGGRTSANGPANGRGVLNKVTRSARGGNKVVSPT